MEDGDQRRRSAYRGNLVFTFSWLKNASEVRPTGTSAGMDTYPGLKTLGNTSTEPQVLAAWNKLFKTSDPLSWISSVSDDEVGIPAQDNAYKSPSANVFPLSSNPFNQSIQTNWFSAACSFAKAHRMTGIYFWGSIMTWNHGALPGAPLPSQSGQVQPKSQKAIKSCFGAH